MCRQPLPPPLSPPSAKLMIMALEEYGYQSRRGIRVPKKWRPIFNEALWEYCDRNYHQILPIIAEKVHQEKVQQEKLKAIKALLNFEEASHHSESGTPIRRRGLK
ncbi:hypothetical protein Tco_0429505 [Tanacetum coccineum]